MKGEYMSPIPIHIIVSGLIALAPAPDGTNQLFALLPDATNPPATRACAAPHVPQLEIQVSDAECAAAHCTLGALCSCSLVRDEIALSISPAPTIGATSLLTKSPPHDLPFDRTEAFDFGYVGNLAALQMSLNPHFRDDAVPPSNLVARMKFPFDHVAACSLSTRRDEGSDNAHVLVLRPLGAPETGKETVRQALAQQLIATIDAADSVTLTLTKFDDPTNVRTFHLISPTGATEFQITLANERAAGLAVDAPCEDGIGRDFAYFYDLAVNPPATWDDRPIPHVKYTRWKSVKDVDPDECHVTATKDPMSRPICPMGAFVP
jgi:hypothetical protein